MEGCRRPGLHFRVSAWLRATRPISALRHCGCAEQSNSAVSLASLLASLGISSRGRANLDENEQTHGAAGTPGVLRPRVHPPGKTKTLMVPPLNSRASGGRHGLKREPPLALVQRAKKRRGWGGEVSEASLAPNARSQKSLLGKTIIQSICVFKLVSECPSRRRLRRQTCRLAWMRPGPTNLSGSCLFGKRGPNERRPQARRDPRRRHGRI